MVGLERWVIAHDGVWLGKAVVQHDTIEAIDPDAVHPQVRIEESSLIVIEDISPIENLFGSATQSAEVLNAIAVLEGIAPELKEMVSTMSAPEIPLTKIITEDHVEILIGNSQNALDKSKIALELLKEHEGAVTLIDVRSVDKPTWRGLDTENL
jgi:hypothetical protein